MPTRRAFLGGLTASLSLAACDKAVPAGSAPAAAPATLSPDDAAAIDRLLAESLSVDLHSHGGRLLRPGAPFEPLAEPMREGHLSALCLAIVADGPTNQVMADGTIKQVRQAKPGQLVAWGEASFKRAHALIADQRLATVRTLVDLDACRTSGPGAIVTSEGGDFLDGSVARVEEAYHRHDLRQLQLTHYRINELGDIQTEAPLHDGLTAFGADVIRACNRLGIVVDVAHGTFDLVKRAVGVATHPLVLSHTSFEPIPLPRSRRISKEHARLVASTGGVVGVWPPRFIFPDRAAYAAGIARMVDVAGIDHVGIGTDMMGLPTGSVFEDYRELPAVAAALRATGFAPLEIAKILGGNYRRVFGAVTRSA
jgi:membrane dipeptidase